MSEARRIPWSVKVLYGVGSAANGVKTRALSGFLMIYYNQVIGLSPALVSAGIMVALIFDAFFDPSVGQASDNFRSNWGRRHPFMYASAIPYALGFFLLWNPPAGLGDGALFAYMLAMLLMIRLFDSFYELPSAALAPELAADYNERTTLISIRWFFGLMSGIVIALLAYQVFMRPEADGSGGILAREGYLAFSITGAAIIFCAILISTLGTHSQIPHLRRAPERTIGIAQMAREMAATLSNPNFAFVAATGMLAAVSLGIAGGLSIYFGLYFWEFDQNQLALLTVGSIGASVAGVTLATPISARFGKKPAALVMFFLAVSVSIVPILGRLLGLMPENGHPAVFWIVFTEQIIYSTLGIMTAIIVTSMIADVVEDNEVRTGRRSEGLLFAADNFFKKLTSGVGVFVAGIILSLVAFPSEARPGAVDEETLRSMALYYVPAIVTLYAISITCLCFYKIDRAAHEENLRKLRAAATPAE